MVGRGDPFYVKFWVKLKYRTCLSEKADFQSIFARSALAVTASEKKFNYH